MHPKKTEIKSSAQPRHDQLLLRLGRCRLLDYTVDLIQHRRTWNPAPPHSSIIREQALTRRLHRRDGTRLAGRTRYQSLGTALVTLAHIEVVADQVQEGVTADKLLRAGNGMAVPQRFGLLHKVNLAGVDPRYLGIGLFVPRPHYHPDLVDPCRQNLLDQNREHRLLGAVTVDQGLQRQGALTTTCRRDDCFFDLHAHFSTMGLAPRVFVDFSFYRKESQRTQPTHTSPYG